MLYNYSDEGKPISGICIDYDNNLLLSCLCYHGQCGLCDLRYTDSCDDANCLGCATNEEFYYDCYFIRLKRREL